MVVGSSSPDHRGLGRRRRRVFLGECGDALEEAAELVERILPGVALVRHVLIENGQGAGFRTGPAILDKSHHGNDSGKLLPFREIAADFQGGTDALFESAEAYIDASPAPTCVVVDVQLPGMSGIELQQRLRAEGPAPPIIVTTARSDEATRELTLALRLDGADTAFARVLECDPESAVWRVYLGLAFEKLGQESSAATYYDQAVKLDGREAEAAFERGAREDRTCFLVRVGGAQHRKRAVDAASGEIEPLAQLHRRGPMTDADQE